jgi:hypothetical protein
VNASTCALLPSLVAKSVEGSGGAAQSIL